MKNPFKKQSKDDRLLEDFEQELDDIEQLEEGQAIKPIRDQRTIRQPLEQRLADIEARMNTLKLQERVLQKEEQLEELEKRIQKRIEDEKFLTEEKKNPDGTIAFRDEKYKLEMEKLQAELDIETDEKRRKEIKARINYMRTTKIYVKFYNGMLKTPRKIAKVVGAIQQATGELSKIGDVSGYEQSGSQNYGFDEKSFFDVSPPTTNTTKKKRKTKRKSKKNSRNSSKKRRKKKSDSQNQDWGFNW